MQVSPLMFYGNSTVRSFSYRSGSADILRSAFKTQAGGVFNRETFDVKWEE